MIRSIKILVIMEDKSPKYDEEVERCLLYGNTHSHIHDELIHSGLNNNCLFLIHTHLI